MLKYLLFPLLCVFVISGATAQDQVLLLNGKSLDGEVKDTSEVNVLLSYRTKKGTNKEVLLERYRIFSITQDGQETILYKRDTLEGNYFTVEEQRMFIYGEKDAMANFKPKWSLYTGLAVGMGMSLFDTYNTNNGQFFDSDPTFIHLFGPFIYTGLTLIPKVRLKLDYASDKNYLAHETYVEGFERAARSKIISRGALGSFAGSAAGLITYFIVNSLR